MGFSPRLKPPPLLLARGRVPLFRSRDFAVGIVLTYRRPSSKGFPSRLRRDLILRFFRVFDFSFVSSMFIRRFCTAE